MRQTLTDKLLTELNTLRGFGMRDVGYTYFADIKGDGSNRRSVWTIINEGGGVTYSALNGSTPATRCRRIRAEIAALRLRLASDAQAEGLDQSRHRVPFKPGSGGLC